MSYLKGLFTNLLNIMIKNQICLIQFNTCYLLIQTLEFIWRSGPDLITSVIIFLEEMGLHYSNIRQKLFGFGFALNYSIIQIFDWALYNEWRAAIMNRLIIISILVSIGFFTLFVEISNVGG